MVLMLPFWDKLDGQVFQIMISWLSFFSHSSTWLHRFLSYWHTMEVFPSIKLQNSWKYHQSLHRHSGQYKMCEFSILGELFLYWRCCNLVNSRVQITYFYNYSFWMKSGIDGVPPWHVRRPRCGRLRRNTGSCVFWEGKKKKMENH